MRLKLWIEQVTQSFWAPPALAMLVGGALGFILPELDNASRGLLGIFSTSDPSSARSLLESIATVTVSVAGITFSVTVVVLQLASQQLGPRVLHTFQTRWIGRITLAMFLGIFVFSLTALGRLGSLEESPNLVLTVALGGAIISFALFTAFIHDIVISIRASTVIRRIGSDAQGLLERPYPAGVGDEPEDVQAAAALFRSRLEGEAHSKAKAPCAGYIAAIDGEALLAHAAETDGLIDQRAMLGDYVVSGQALATVAARDDVEGFAGAVAGCFSIESSRSLVQDVAFPVRQLADVALRALSPSMNDPTTAENATGAIAEILVRLARSQPAQTLRADAKGEPRLQTRVPDLDGMVRLGFEQLIAPAAEDPILRERVGHFIAEVRSAASEGGRSTAELERQAQRLAATG